MATIRLTPGMSSASALKPRSQGSAIGHKPGCAFDRPHRFTHRTRVPFGTMSHQLTFEPEDGGTRLIQDGWLEPNLIGRLMTPLIGRMLGRRLPDVARELGEYLAAEHPGTAART